MLLVILLVSNHKLIVVLSLWTMTPMITVNRTHNARITRKWLILVFHAEHMRQYGSNGCCLFCRCVRVCAHSNSHNVKIVYFIANLSANVSI